MMYKPDDHTRFTFPPTPPGSPRVGLNKLEDSLSDTRSKVTRQNRGPIPPTPLTEPALVRRGAKSCQLGLWLRTEGSGKCRGDQHLGSRRQGFEASAEEPVTSSTTATTNQVELERESRADSRWEHSALQRRQQERDLEVSPITALTPTSMESGGDTAHEEGEDGPSELGPRAPKLKAMVNGEGVQGSELDLFSVPKGARVREFVGEGSANVVVSIELPGDVSPETRKFFEGKLLRLQKASENPEKKPYPYPVQYQYWKDCVKPLFAEKDDLVSHDLVRLGYGHNIIGDVDNLLTIMDHVTDVGSKDDLPHELKGWLSDLEGSEIKERKKQFLGSKLARVEYAILVEDMRVDEKDGVLIEIKPKWLLQSPSAPANAVRCRNCAIQLHRRLKDPSLGDRKHPCPLLLISEDWLQRRLYMTSLFKEHELGSWYVQPLRKWFRGITGSKPKRLLARLRSLQDCLDKKGPLGASADDEDFQLAMTLRDCSVFLRVLKPPGDSVPKVVAKLADLDKKNAEAKISYWKRTEAELVRDGAYTGAYKMVYDTMMAEPVRTGCVLEETRLPFLTSLPIRCRKVEDNKLIGRGDMDRYKVGVGSGAR